MSGWISLAVGLTCVVVAGFGLGILFERQKPKP